jgi:hypothetical protein
MIPLYVEVLLVWNVLGGLLLLKLWVDTFKPQDSNNILSPIWIYSEWKLNYFGAGIVCLIFNLLCPTFSIILWFCKFTKFICTVGRR